ncbi:MAG: YfhO family protein, partial [Chloroflexota bacterium]|nr:YfhO family protein [Chloroflexota bacterium]
MSVVPSSPPGTAPASGRLHGSTSTEPTGRSAWPSFGASSRPLATIGRRFAVPLLFAALALAFVGSALLPGRALLPIDNLFQFPPWRAYADDFGVEIPHNPLISDAILQNYSWKWLARESLARGELPLWNPYILSGQPFMAAGQNGALYPLGILFYVLPLASAYGWFIALHLWLGALFAYLFARTLGANPLGGVVAGVTFGFSGYLVVKILWPMVVSTAIWLPALLTIVELIVRQSAGAPWPARRVPLPLLVALGALVVGLQFLAGHLEMSLYLLLTAGLYTALRLVGRLRAVGLWRTFVAGLAALMAVALGTGLAAILLVPFSEVIGANVRTGWSDYEETVGYALPRERAIAWLMPDYFGNPTHHTYVDVFGGETRPVEHQRPNGELRTDTEWGGHNYVEGTAYVGVLPLLLALVALARRPTGGAAALGLVAVISVLFAFGTPLYAVLFYG